MSEEAKPFEIHSVEEVNETLEKPFEPIEAHSVEEINENLEKPWYFSTVEIYKLVKTTAASIPQSKEIFEKSLKTISDLTKYINASTNIQVAFDVDKSVELINQLDGTLSDTLIRLDDGLDGLRSNLNRTVHGLLDAVVKHKEWAQSTLSKTKDSALEGFVTRYENSLGVLKSILVQAKERYPKSYELVDTYTTKSYEAVNTLSSELKNRSIGYLESTKDTALDAYSSTVGRINDAVQDKKKQILDIHTKIDSDVKGTITNILTQAQPYVHQTYIKAVPYVDYANQVSQPYINNAKPYVDPLLEKAVTLNNSLLESAYFGPYAKSAYELLNKALIETESYVIPPSPVN